MSNTFRPPRPVRQETNYRYVGVMTGLVDFVAVAAGSGRTEESAKMEAARKYMTGLNGGVRQ